MSRPLPRFIRDSRRNCLAVVGGSVPLALTWQINGTNLTDGPSGIGTISGSSTGKSDHIPNLTPADEGQTFNVTLVTSNSQGAFTNDPAVVTFTVSAPGMALKISMPRWTFEAQGHWIGNTGSSWSDGNPVSVSVFFGAGQHLLHRAGHGWNARPATSPMRCSPARPAGDRGKWRVAGWQRRPAFATQYSHRRTAVCKQSGAKFFTVTNFGTTV